MDIALPGADGFEVARRLRAIPGVGRSVCFIALTGFGQPGDSRRSEEAGFARHLIKPVDSQELDRVLKEVAP